MTEKNLRGSKFLVFPHCALHEVFVVSSFYWKISRKSFTVKLILRNKSQEIQKCFKLHTVRCTLRKNEKFTLLTNIFFHQFNSLVFYLVNVLLSRNLLSHLFGKISWKQRFSKFSTLCVYLYTLVGITYVCMYLIRPLHQEAQVAKICKENKYWKRSNFPFLLRKQIKVSYNG